MVARVITAAYPDEAMKVIAEEKDKGDDVPIILKLQQCICPFCGNQLEESGDDVHFEVFPIMNPLSDLVVC